MKKTALVLATVGALAVGTIGTATPAKAWHGGWGWGPGIAGGLIAGAVIGGIASSAYGWGPGYGYYGGYAPAYYGGYTATVLTCRCYRPITRRLTAIVITASSVRPMPIMAVRTGITGSITGAITVGTTRKPRSSASDTPRRPEKKPPRERRLLR